jgi:hypothetical protein
MQDKLLGEQDKRNPIVVPATASLTADSPTVGLLPVSEGAGGSTSMADIFGVLFSSTTWTAKQKPIDAMHPINGRSFLAFNT